jgi:type II secretory ATPase GspE/PulE/Tfp pilus assembly ATPase PilB-like protein
MSIRPETVLPGGGTGVPLQMDDVRVDPMLALRVPANLATRREMLPFVEWRGRVHVACADVRDAASLGAVQRAFELPVEPVAAEPDSLRRALARVYGNLKPGAGSMPAIGRTGSRGGEGEPFDAAGLSDDLLYSAVLRQASDIHIDPGPDTLRVRFRVDGGLEEIQRFPMAHAGNLTNRFKVLAQMDISEKRAPQDGAFRHNYGDGRTLDIRAATLPTKWGERLTLRLLGLQTGVLTLERLGMDAGHLQLFEAALAQPHGMILLTGPTGSGKSTTLYAGIRRLLEMESLNIITVEDPVEYDIQGVAQVSVDSADKTSFAGALRSILRHDPDVVMIGEIRDGETAGIAVKASLTGHLVFSSLHTNTAAGAVTRLGDMGVERYLIASTLRLSIAQRLVKKLCPRCHRPGLLTEAEARSLGRPDATGQVCYSKGGCLYCGGKGTAGRLALFEFLPLDESWSQIVNRGAQEVEILAEMKRRGLSFLLDDALLKMASGVTSFEEVRNAVAAW